MLLVIDFVVVSRHQQTPPLTSDSLTRPGPSHLALEPFTARDGTIYWLRIAISAYPPAFDVPVSGGGASEYRNIAMISGAEKLECCGYPTVKKN